MKPKIWHVMAAVCAMGMGVAGQPADAATAKRFVPRRWCSLGTSITWYNNHVAPSFTKGYQTRVMERIRFSGFVNRGVNGGCVASAIGNVVPAGFYTIEHGVNDWGNRVNPGTMEDYLNDTGTGTFAGGYRKVVNAIRAASPKAKIILCTPRKGYGFGTYLPARCDERQKGGYFLEDYVKIVRGIAAKEGFLVADFYGTCGEQDELASLSIDKALHPNDAGYQRMADELVKTILKQFPDAREVKTGPAAFTDDGKPKSVTVNECVATDPQAVLFGTKLSQVTVEGAKMGGAWIPNGPFESSVRFLERDPSGTKMTCQVQVRPPDNCTRAIGLEFAQDGSDVTVRALWSRYSFKEPVGTDFELPGSSETAPIAAALTDFGYVVSSLTLGVNKPDLPEAVAKGKKSSAALAEAGALAYRGTLGAAGKVVLKNVSLESVTPSAAFMGGAWIPGGPFASTVHFVRKNASTGSKRFQVQVRPPDDCTRCIGVELKQQGTDVAARILWARYSWNGPVGTDFEKPGYSGVAPIAESMSAEGYGISALSFVRAK